MWGALETGQVTPQRCPYQGEGPEGLICPGPISTQTVPRDSNSPTLLGLGVLSAVPQAEARPATVTQTLAAGSKSLGRGKGI